MNANSGKRQSGRKQAPQGQLEALPALAAGTFTGMSLFGRINERKFRCSILVLLLISGALMLG